MRIMSLALGGCLKGPPVQFGLTGDTGGHITYVLGASFALASRDDVDGVEIVTRLIDDPGLGAAYANPYEPLGPKLAICRIDSGNRAYLSKEAAAADRPAFTRALLAQLERSTCRPDVIHAHFADAAEVAAAVRDRFGIPFVYTSHSLGIDKAACIGADDAGMAGRIASETRAIAGADAIIASSRDEAERQLMRYAGADPARIHCVPPGAALDSTEAGVAGARALLAPVLRDPAKPMLLAIARPVVKKNLAGLVDLYAADAELRRRANLVIVAGLRDGPDTGEPEQREVIRGLLERLDCHDLYGSLALPKRHDAADIGALYALARESHGVFVNPAWTEPYGLTLTEAATHGLPVVATCHGGPADIVARLGHGLVADPRDPGAFAAAIRRLLDDPVAWRTASAAGKERSRTLGWPAYAARFVRIAAGLTDAKPSVGDRVQPLLAQLLLSDIDNTLTGCRDGARELRILLARRPELGFGVATGRSLQEAERLLEEWHYPGPCVLVTSVGSEIYWRRGGRLVADAAFAARIAEGWRRDAVARTLAALPGLTPQPTVEQRRFKLSYFAEGPTIVGEIEAALAGAGLAARVIHSHGNLLDVLPARAGKGAAMRRVAEALGLHAERVHAAGDSGNDIDMLEACPNAIIVANHDEALAALTGRPHVYVTRRPHAGGIVEAMSRAHSGHTA